MRDQVFPRKTAPCKRSPPQPTTENSIQQSPPATHPEAARYGHRFEKISLLSPDRPASPLPGPEGRPAQRFSGVTGDVIQRVKVNWGGREIDTQTLTREELESLLSEVQWREKGMEVQTALQDALDEGDYKGANPYGIELVAAGVGDREDHAKGRRLTALHAQKSARELVVLAVSYLKHIEQSREALGHFLSVFHDIEAAPTVIKNLERVASYLATTQLRDGYREDHVTSVKAFTQHQVITLQKPFFDNSTDEARENTVIHEAVHAALDGKDHSYTSERLITALTPAAALNNPDSYVWFLEGIIRGNLAPKGQVQDVFQGADAKDDGRFESEISKVIGLKARYLIDTHRLIEQAYEEAADTVQTQRPAFGQNTRYCIQEILRAFPNLQNKWNINVPSQEIVDGLGTVARVIQYLYGGLSAPVTVTKKIGGDARWSRNGVGPVHLEIPVKAVDADLFGGLMRLYIRDLLLPTKGEKWKGYYNLVATIAPQFVDLRSVLGQPFNAPDKI